MSVISDGLKTNLLFKRFTGVAATQLDQEFSNEPFQSREIISIKDIRMNLIPDQASASVQVLDNSAAWADSTSSSGIVNGQYNDLDDSRYTPYFAPAASNNVLIDRVYGEQGLRFLKNVFSQLINFI